MKKSSFFVLSMMALTFVFGFSACSSSEEEVVNNPNYDPLTKTVNANFVFSVSTGNTSSGTRQSSATTQATLGEVFRGIGTSQLFAFHQASDGKHVTAPMTVSKGYDLGAILEPNRLDPDGTGIGAGGDGVPLSHRVIELSLPIETNTLMFWGKAPKSGSSAASGEISFDLSSSDLTKHSFSLMPRIMSSGTSSVGKEAFEQYEHLILFALNTIAQTTIYNEDVVVGGATKHITSLSWSDYVDLTGSTITAKTTDPFESTAAGDMSSNGSLLGEVFSVFHTIADGEIRGGSGPAVAYMMGDLYNALYPVASSVPTTFKEAAAQLVGIAVRKNIETFFDLNSPATWLSISDILNHTSLETLAVNLISNDGNVNSFPANFGVPSGIVQLAFTPSSCQWRYDEDSHSIVGSGTASVNDYMYPAELCYFGNSPVRVTDAAKTPSQYPDGVSAWDSDASWSGWIKDGSVQPTTRSVAMRDNINYGTSLLESTVRYGSAVLEDNKGNAIEVGESSFQLTGIIIGGQPKTVGWNYLAKDGATSSFNYMIYDNSLPSTAIPSYTASGSKSVPNYTLVWDNWHEAQRNQDQSLVYVALEFKNTTGRDFYGRDNNIPNGGTFYIAGRLDPDQRPSTLTDVSDAAYKSDKSLGIVWPSNYALPPYDTDGQTLKQRRVFIQDYMTVAHFVLNKNSLKNAYVTVPDLRSLQISLGLSVDLEWQTGLTFDVPLGE